MYTALTMQPWYNHIPASIWWWWLITSISSSSCRRVSVKWQISSTYKRIWWFQGKMILCFRWFDKDNMLSLLRLKGSFQQFWPSSASVQTHRPSDTENVPLSKWRRSPSSVPAACNVNCYCYCYCYLRVKARIILVIWTCQAQLDGCRGRGRRCPRSGRGQLQLPPRLGQASAEVEGE